MRVVKSVKNKSKGYNARNISFSTRRAGLLLWYTESYYIWLDVVINSPKIV